MKTAQELVGLRGTEYDISASIARAIEAHSAEKGARTGLEADGRVAEAVGEDDVAKALVGAMRTFGASRRAIGSVVKTYAKVAAEQLAGPTAGAEADGVKRLTPREAVEFAARIVKERRAEAGGGEGVDAQGNPVDADGRLKLEPVESVADLTDADFTKPTRNVRLPKIPANIDAAIGADGKPVIIKKNIFAKNAKQHPELSAADGRSILERALYNPNLVGQTQPVSRPTYKVAIQTGDRNAVTVLEVSRTKDNVEIIGWRNINERGLELMKKQAAKEGGQLLVLHPSGNGQPVALSGQQRGSSTTSISNRGGEDKGVKRPKEEGNLYTGSAADYAERVPMLDRDGWQTVWRIDNAPSLQHVGSGEGSQVYGWGLYASNQRGVAEGYASSEEDVARSRRYREYLAKRRDEASDEWQRKYFEDELRAAEKAAINSTIYEQTFFTDRADGEETERHLLKWYEPVSEEQRKWIADRLRQELGDDTWTYDGQNLYRSVPINEGRNKRKIIFPTASSARAYDTLSGMLGSPQAASEFLARAGIDGVKYPVDSYGGKTVKDGDEAGWNYVSFRDDNIRVDHKWVDGQMRYSLAGVTPGGYADRDFHGIPGNYNFIGSHQGMINARRAIGEDERKYERVEDSIADAQIRAALDPRYGTGGFRRNAGTRSCLARCKSTAATAWRSTPTRSCGS